eukprot:gb/GEZN01007090.1/.p1 GENE.gb/GEZN01007090.1/~~gb/GEZN01007090.1/.p1  ORF type:complete len:477 (+),score=36.93 gb/GEZN01007090.1/:22-1452(+)
MPPISPDKPLAQLKVHDSHFMAYVFKTSSKEELEEIVQTQIKPQHPGAAHIPWAWRADYANDGEPPNSAGPALVLALEAATSLTQQDLSNVAVVVVRYWGSVLLGVTIGRLPQCYYRVAYRALFAFTAGPSEPLEATLSAADGPVFGLGVGDSEVLPCLISTQEASSLMSSLKNTLVFSEMAGPTGKLPRLQALNAKQNGGIIPIYRYPGNVEGTNWPTLPWLQDFTHVCSLINAHVKEDFNHCVTNYYRDGKDNIAHHTDKMLDIRAGSTIVSVSLGEARMLELRSRSHPRDVYRVLLPSGSLFVLGPLTNESWTHSIVPVLEDQQASSVGPRMSLTIRNVATFYDPGAGVMWGQGTAFSSQSDALAALRAETRVAAWTGGVGAMASVLGLCVGATVHKRSHPTPPWIQDYLTEKDLRVDRMLLLAGVAGVASVGVFSLVGYWLCKRRQAHRRQQNEIERARAYFSKNSSSGTQY